MIIKKNWKYYNFKNFDTLKRCLHDTIQYIKVYKEKLEFGLGKKVINDNTFNELIDTKFEYKYKGDILQKKVDKKLRMNCKVLVDWKELIDNALKDKVLKD
ncbi:hypothetical protein ABK040_015462 [Willaertia magna]